MRLEVLDELKVILCPIEILELGKRLKTTLPINLHDFPIFIPHNLEEKTFRIYQYFLCNGIKIRLIQYALFLKKKSKVIIFIYKYERYNLPLRPIQNMYLGAQD